MAALKLLSEQPERLTLGKGGGGGGLIGILFFGVITFVALSSLFEDGLTNPVVIIILLVIGFAFLNNLARALSSTRVVLDAGQRIATRTDTLLFLPIRRRDLSFNLIRDVQVTRISGNAAFTLDSLPIWQVVLQATDGGSLVVNEKGTRSEMDALAHKVGTLLGRPVRLEQTTQTPTPAAPTAEYTPTTVATSLYENLVAFAQSTTVANVSPPIVAPTVATLRDRQDNAERTRRERERKRTDQPRSTPANTFTPAPPTIDPDAPFLQASQALASDQQAFATANAWSVGPDTFSVAYTAPPALVMPDLPAMASFGPALNMPSFPPLGANLPAPSSTFLPAPEIKTVQAIVTPASNTVSTLDDAATQARAARQFLSARNFRDAQAAFLRALSTSPADGAVHNDLGVVYLEQNKLTDAERAFRRSIALDPFAGAARYNLGIVLNRLGKRSESLEQFNVGIQNANATDANRFREAQRGILRSPVISS